MAPPRDLPRRRSHPVSRRRAITFVSVASALLAVHLLLSIIIASSFQLPHQTHWGAPSSSRRGPSLQHSRPPPTALHASPAPNFEAGEEVVIVDDDGATRRTGVVEARRGGWYTVVLGDATRAKRRGSGLQRKVDGETEDVQSVGSARDGLPAKEPVEIVDLDSILRSGHGNIHEHLSASNQTISADTLRQIAHCHSHCTKWVIFSDLHVMPSTLPTCLKVLDAVHDAALRRDAGILFLGDFWHHRGFVRVDCLNAVLEAMGRWTVPSILIPGNHDQIDWRGMEHALTPLCNAYRIGSRVAVNGDGSSERYPGPLILSQPTKFLDALFVPHTRDKATMQSILSSNEAASASALFVHADVKGASMNDLIASEHGLPGSLFPADKQIYSGHFHKPHVVQLGKSSSLGMSLRYVGSPYQTSFAEVGQEKALLLVDARKQWQCVEEIPIDVGPRYHRVSSVRRFVEVSGADFREGDKVAVMVSQKELEEMRAQAAEGETPEESPFDARLIEMREAGVSVEIRDIPPQQQDGLPGASADADEVDLEDLSPRATLSAYLDDEVEKDELGEATARALLEGGLDLLRDIADGGDDDVSSSKSPPRDATVTELELESVSVQGFGSFRTEVDYPLNKRGVVLLRGTNEDHGSDSNGAGKSTLAMAPLWALAGSVDPRPAQDGKVSDFVHDGSKGASVTVRGTINSKPFLVKRTKTKTTKGSSLTFVLDGVDMTRQSSKDTQAVIDDHFRNVDLLTRTVFHGEHAIGGLLESTDARLKDELSYLVSLDVWQKAASLARSKQREVMRKASGLEGMLTLRRKDKTAAEVKCNAAKSEADERKRLLERESEALLQDEHGTANDLDMAGVEEAMVEVQAQLHQSSGQVARLEEELSILTDSNSEGLSELRSKAQEKMAAENEARANLLSKQRSYDLAAMELKAAERQLCLLQSEWNVENGSLDAASMHSPPETCRTCGQPINSSESKQHVMESVQEKLTAATAQVDKARDSFSAATASFEQAREYSEAGELEVHLYMKDLREAEETLSRNTDGLHKEIKAARLRQSDLSSEFASLARQAKEISEAKLATSQRQASLDRLSEAMQASVATYESCRYELDAIEATIGELETDKAAKTSSASLYTSLADAFGPKGIQAFVLQNIVQALQHCSQAYLDELSDGSLQLRMGVGPNDNIVKQAAIRNPGGTWRVRPLSSLSGGQWRRCSLSLSLGFIQLASKRGKLRSSLLVLDEPLTHLDSAGRKSVGRLLRKMLSQDPRIGNGTGRSGFDGLSTILVILQEIAAEEIEECFDQIDEVIKSGGESVVVLDENNREN
ncbi:hypothetical protein ACHAXT_002109 [Thalassiosira profunda]